MLCLLDMIKMFRLPNQAEGDYREDPGNCRVTRFADALIREKYPNLAII